jgi:hypothetical protein
MVVLVPELADVDDLRYQNSEGGRRLPDRAERVFERPRDE